MEYCSFSPLLDAYHDGELDDAAARQVRGHVPGCWSCSEELDAIEAISLCISDELGPRLSMIERVRLHREIDQRSESDVLRMVGVLTALAASVLIVSAVWLTEFPTRHTTAVSPAVVVVPASEMPAWERIASTLKVDPRPQSFGDLRFVDARSDVDFSDWVLSTMSGGNPGSP